MKNVNHLQARAPGILPRHEPLEGFASHIPVELLSRLHTRIPPSELTGYPELAAWLRETKVPGPTIAAREPLFNGSLYFVGIDFRTSAGSLSLNPKDIATAMDYARLAIGPISRYASQYGPNRIDVSPTVLPFSIDLHGSRYNDQMLQGWVNTLVAQNMLPVSSCIVVLNPPGIVNTDADMRKGIGGYHSIADVPYIFVNLSGQNFTIDDRTQLYALPLSHEIAELAVDPRADSVNPEVCDPCG